jgi:hypothetical protein
MVDSRRIERRRAALDAMHNVALAKQEFSEIRAILAGNSGD